MKRMKYITLFAAIGTCHLFAYEQEEANEPETVQQEEVAQEEEQQSDVAAQAEQEERNNDDSLVAREEGEAQTVHLE